MARNYTKDEMSFAEALTVVVLALEWLRERTPEKDWPKECDKAAKVLREQAQTIAPDLDYAGVWAGV